MKTMYETIIVTFEEDITTISNNFSSDVKTWGSSSLKEWIEHYESSRFTEISRNKAVITSDYNMDYIIAWINNNLQTLDIDIIS